MQIPFIHSDAHSGIPDALFPFLCASYVRSLEVLRRALRLLRPLTEVPMCLQWRYGILRLSLTAAVLCLFPSYFGHFEQNYYSRQARKKFAHPHTTQWSAPSCARISVESAAFAAAPLESPFLGLAPLPHRKIPGPALWNHAPARLQLHRPALPGQRCRVRIGWRRHSNLHNPTVTADKERSLRRF